MVQNFLLLAGLQRRGELMRTSAKKMRKSLSGRLRQTAWMVLAVLLLAAAALTGCRGSAAMAKENTMKLTTSSFQENQIPVKFTCSGAGISPQLAWDAPPAGTASFALIVTDPDAPGRTFVH